MVENAFGLLGSRFSMFVICPTVMILAVLPKTWKSFVLMESDQVKDLLPTTSRFPFKYGRYCSVASG